MSLFSWNQELSVNIDSIDEQHKRLIVMINDFYNNVSNRSSKENISILIDAMKKYTVEHFGFEEKYMKQFGYPDYEAHKKEHDEFITRVAEIEKMFLDGKHFVSLEATLFIKDWLKDHIQGSDMQYSEFFIKNGIR